MSDKAKKAMDLIREMSKRDREPKPRDVTTCSGCGSTGRCVCPTNRAR